MSKSDSARAREHRLAVKLRENLRRRKGLKGTAGEGEEPPAPPKPHAPRQDDEKR